MAESTLPSEDNTLYFVKENSRAGYFILTLFFNVKKHVRCKTDFKCKYIPRIGATVTF
jgi:hypothetical protein